MRKSQISPMPKYFDRYIHLAEDVTVLQALNISLQELENAPLDLWMQLGEKVYAPNKWTIKDMLQHIIDTERVFSYRIISIARGDKQKMKPYDEDVFANSADANRRELKEIYDELLLVRKCTIAMFSSFTDEMLLQIGNGYSNIQYSPLALGFMLVGHQRWHFRVLEERYYPLAK